MISFKAFAVGTIPVSLGTGLQEWYCHLFGSTKPGESSRFQNRDTFIDAFRSVWRSIQFYSEYEVCENSMYNYRIQMAPQVVLGTGNIYGLILVSSDKHWNILTEQVVNRESSKMRGDIIVAVAQENHSRTILTHTDWYG